MGNRKRFEKFPIDFGTRKEETIEAFVKIYGSSGLLNTELLINEVQNLASKTCDFFMALRFYPP